MSSRCDWGTRGRGKRSGATLIYNCSRNEVIVGVGVFRLDEGEDRSCQKRRETGRQVALLDKRFYVLGMLEPGESAAGNLKRAGYILEAERPVTGTIGIGDRMALVWGW